MQPDGAGSRFLVHTESLESNRQLRLCTCPFNRPNFQKRERKSHIKELALNALLSSSSRITRKRITPINYGPTEFTDRTCHLYLKNHLFEFLFPKHSHKAEHISFRSTFDQTSSDCQYLERKQQCFVSGKPLHARACFSKH